MMEKGITEWSTFKLGLTGTRAVRKTVDPASDEYAEFKGRSGLPESVFTLQRLYIDVTCKWTSRDFCLPSD